MRLSKLFLAASAAVLLTACQPASETTSETLSYAKTAISETPKLALTGIPHAQLPDNVTPKGYRVDMMIDPQQDGMSGIVAIDVTVNDASDRIWIHAKEMTVSAARIDYRDGSTAELTFNAISLEDAPSGLSLIHI